MHEAPMYWLTRAYKNAQLLKNNTPPTKFFFFKSSQNKERVLHMHEIMNILHIVDYYYLAAYFHSNMMCNV